MQHATVAMAAIHERGVFVSPYFVFGLRAVMAVNSQNEQILIMPVRRLEDLEATVEAAWDVLERLDPPTARPTPLRVL